MSDRSEDRADSVSDSSARFKFTHGKRFRFTIFYLFFKTLRFWHDVKSPRGRLFVYEVIYSVCRGLHRTPPALRSLDLKRVTTIFGTFNIRPGSTDAACVSPAFERLDLDHLLSLLHGQLKDGRTVLFIDVGADVGTYAISVANCLRTVGKIRVLAFEPSSSSFNLLHKNVEENGLSGIVVPHQIALGDGSASLAFLEFDLREPGGGKVHAMPGPGHSQQVRISTIDAEVGIDELADIVVLKLDVEGSEIAVLEGAVATVAAAGEVLLLVEDFIDTRIVAYLESQGWSFQRKLTPYNSFWRIARSTSDSKSPGVNSRRVTRGNEDRVHDQSNRTLDVNHQ